MNTASPKNFCCTLSSQNSQYMLIDQACARPVVAIRDVPGKLQSPHYSQASKVG